MKTILVDAVDCFVSKESQIFSEMHELLETYPNRKIILSNADDAQVVEWGLDKMPYEVFTLKHSPDKVNPQFFRTMLSHFGLTNEEVVYFEHNPEAVQSAQSVGIQTYFYDSDAKDLKELKRFLNEKL